MGQLVLTYLGLWIYIYMHIYVTINEKVGTKLKKTKQGCIGGFGSRKVKSKLCNYITI